MNNTQTNIDEYGKFQGVSWEEEKEENFIYFSDVGTSVEGVIIEKQEERILLELPNKQRKWLPNLEILRRKLKDKDVGTIVKIVYLGSQACKHDKYRSYHNFQIFTGKK